MDETPRSLRVERVGRTDRRGPVLLLVTAVAIAIAALKPWQAASERPGTAVTANSGVAVALPSRVVVATVTPSMPATAVPTPTLSVGQAAALAARDRRQCQSNVGWRVVTMEQTGARRTRTLLAVDPRATRDGLADARIPTVVLYAERLTGIGYCVPAVDGAAVERPRPEVEIWRILPSGQAVHIEDPVTLDAGLSAAGESYFGPPAGSPRLWPPGRYVFEIIPASPRTLNSYFALEYRVSVAGAAGDAAAERSPLP